MLKRNNNLPSNKPSKAGIQRSNRGYSRLEKLNIAMLCMLTSILLVQLSPYIIYFLEMHVIHGQK